MAIALPLSGICVALFLSLFIRLALRPSLPRCQRPCLRLFVRTSIRQSIRLFLRLFSTLVPTRVPTHFFGLFHRLFTRLYSPIPRLYLRPCHLSLSLLPNDIFIISLADSLLLFHHIPPSYRSRFIVKYLWRLLLNGFHVRDVKDIYQREVLRI
jgi:hypothetical protein